MQHPSSRCHPAQVAEPSLQLTVRFHERTREEVIAAYCGDVMPGGMLIRSAKQPLLKLGTYVRLRFLLASGEEIFSGVGLVAWLQRRGAQLGVGVHFEELTPPSQALYHRMLERKEQLEASTAESQTPEEPTGRWLAAADRRAPRERFEESTAPVDTPLPSIV